MKQTSQFVSTGCLFVCSFWFLNHCFVTWLRSSNSFPGQQGKPNIHLQPSGFGHTEQVSSKPSLMMPDRQCCVCSRDFLSSISVFASSWTQESEAKNVPRLHSSNCRALDFENQKFFSWLTVHDYKLLCTVASRTKIITDANPSFTRNVDSSNENILGMWTLNRDSFGRPLSWLLQKAWSHLTGLVFGWEQWRCVLTFSFKGKFSLFDTNYLVCPKDLLPWDGRRLRLCDWLTILLDKASSYVCLMDKWRLLMWQLAELRDMGLVYAAVLPGPNRAETDNEESDPGSTATVVWITVENRNDWVKHFSAK